LPVQQVQPEPQELPVALPVQQVQPEPQELELPQEAGHLRELATVHPTWS
jgi:hypothetical protein